MAGLKKLPQYSNQDLEEEGSVDAGHISLQSDNDRYKSVANRLN